MNLTTRCPQCETAFDVSLAQLQLRKGYVRCVQCGHIFDGYEAVVPGATGVSGSAGAPGFINALGATDVPTDVRKASAHSEAHPPGSVITPTEPVLTVDGRSDRLPVVMRGRGDREFTISAIQGAGSGHAARSGPGLDEPSVTLPVDGAGEMHDVRDEPVVSMPLQPDPAQTPVHTLPIRAPVRRGPGTDELVQRALAQRDHEDRRTHHLAGAARIMWSILVLLGLVVLVFQLLVVFRVQIALTVPALRPGLERLCAELGCELAYARRIDQIRIVRSSLEADATARDEDGADLLLDVTLHNRHDKAQEWPGLILELRDGAGALLVRRFLGSDVYLRPELRSRPFAPDSEYRIRLPLEVQGLEVNGYQLSLFFP